ncbi:hypothetical protein EGM88_07285 [Aureibaculum marinum]|uniref:Uncharacterized protein n=1 Tax=Aureibaculum marinum TaxID=2487930 RepID=A0A3N4NNV4_9FLAO|nr:DUF6642 family protein [Aureibaculum marinum]RPD97961.1 hypothetical protein EGM88_07285 [Aureibaculum marinum]
MLAERQLPQENFEDPDHFIFCLEAVPDVDSNTDTKVLENLEHLAMRYGVNSIHKTCDTIEGLLESLNALVYDDHNFKNYEIIYFVFEGEENNICINNYFYSLQEIAELFEGKLQGKILHFSNAKVLDLEAEEAQYFLAVTGAQGISGYGVDQTILPSLLLDKAFFSLFKNKDDMFDVVEELHQRHYNLCKMLDFRMYY